MYKLTLSKINIDNFILLLIFLSPACNLVIFKASAIDIRIIQILWATAFCCLLLKKTILKEDHGINKKDYIIFCLYILAIILSCLFSSNLSRSVKELFQYIYLFLIMYFLHNKMKDSDFLRKVIDIFIVSNAIFVTICLISYFSGKILIPSITIYQNGHLDIGGNIYKTQLLVESGEAINRINSIMGMGPISIANLVLIQSIFVNYYIKTRENLRIFSIILLCANTVVVILTYSRAAFLIFVVCHVILFLGKNKLKNFGIIFCAVAIFGVVLTIYPDVFDRILESFNFQEGSSKYHFVFWIIALKTGFNHIFTGIGLGNIAFSLDNFTDLFSTFGIYEANGVDVHNFLLQIWSEQGSIGLVMNMLLVLLPICNYVYIRINKIGNVHPLYKYAIVAYCATLAYNLTNNNYYIETFWIILAMVYSLKVKLDKDLVCSIKFFGKTQKRQLN